MFWDLLKQKAFNNPIQGFSVQGFCSSLTIKTDVGTGGRVVSLRTFLPCHARKVIITEVTGGKSTV